jgi:hypothetical protein
MKLCDSPQQALTLALKMATDSIDNAKEARIEPTHGES